MFRFGLYAGVLLLATASAMPGASISPAHAADEKEKEKDELDLDDLKKKLESGQEPVVLDVLATIAKSRDPKAAPLVNWVLERGSTVKVIDAALTAAAALEVESSSAAIAPYVRHRIPVVRKRAVRALLETGGPAAVTALRRGLRSQDPAVRGLSASGLGKLGARAALGDLFRAFDYGVGEAAASIGQLCEPKECEKFAERLGKVPFDIMTSGIDEILFRPKEQMPDEQKIRLIEKVRDLGTAEAGRYLAGVAERWPEDYSEAVKKALEAAARASRGSAR